MCERFLTEGSVELNGSGDLLFFSSGRKTSVANTLNTMSGIRANPTIPLFFKKVKSRSTANGYFLIKKVRAAEMPVIAYRISKLWNA